MCNPRTGQTNKQLFQPIPYLKKKKKRTNVSFLEKKNKTKKQKNKTKNDGILLTNPQ